MRDGIATARRGVPAVALVTEAFWPQGDFVARSAGMPGVPRVQLPHPVAGTGVEAMARVAEKIAPEVVAALRGPASGGGDGPSGGDGRPGASAGGGAAR